MLHCLVLFLHMCLYNLANVGKCLSQQSIQLAHQLFLQSCQVCVGLQINPIWYAQAALAVNECKLPFLVPLQRHLDLQWMPAS